MIVSSSRSWKNRPEPKMPRPVVRKPGESGFALLIVFVMAAAISIGLYLELPRSVFESQRAKKNCSSTAATSTGWASSATT